MKKLALAFVMVVGLSTLAPHEASARKRMTSSYVTCEGGNAVMYNTYEHSFLGFHWNSSTATSLGPC